MCTALFLNEIYTHMKFQVNSPYSLRVMARTKKWLKNRRITSNTVFGCKHKSHLNERPFWNSHFEIFKTGMYAFGWQTISNLIEIVQVISKKSRNGSHFETAAILKIQKLYTPLWVMFNLCVKFDWDRSFYFREIV